MSHLSHQYEARLVWDGNRGEGTASYQGYGREYRVLIAGKPELAGSADSAFRGDAHKLNPEEMFVAAISACHLLSYLALCARQGIRVVSYEDEAQGTMKEDGKGGGRFEEVVLRPTVTIADARDADRAMELHRRAHEVCFIASSCSIPIRHDATICS